MMFIRFAQYGWRSVGLAGGVKKFFTYFFCERSVGVTGNVLLEISEVVGVGDRGISK